MKRSKKISLAFIIIGTFFLSPNIVSVKAEIASDYISDLQKEDFGFWYEGTSQNMIVHTIDGSVKNIKGYRRNANKVRASEFEENKINRDVVNAVEFAKAMGFEGEYDVESKIFYTEGYFSVDLEYQEYNYAEGGEGTSLVYMPEWIGTAVEYNEELYIPIEIAMEVYKAYRVRNDDISTIKYEFKSLDKIYKDNPRLDFNKIVIYDNEITIGETTIDDIYSMFGEPYESIEDRDTLKNKFKMGDEYTPENGELTVVSDKRGWLQSIKADNIKNTKYLDIVLGKTLLKDAKLKIVGDLKYISKEGSPTHMFSALSETEYSGAHDRITGYSVSSLGKGTDDSNVANALGIYIYRESTSTR